MHTTGVDQEINFGRRVNLQETFKRLKTLELTVIMIRCSSLLNKREMRAIREKKPASTINLNCRIFVSTLHFVIIINWRRNLMNEELNLDVLREEIKKITVEIIRLTGRRLSLAKKVGDIKIKKKLPIEDLKVERELKQIILKKCKKYNINSSFGLEFLNLLIDEAKRVQKEILNKDEKKHSGSR